MKSKLGSAFNKAVPRGPLTRYAPLAFVFVLLLLMVSCTTVPPDSATLVLTVEDPYGAKTLLPDIDMKPAGYDFSGIGPNGDSFSVPDGKTPVSVPSLKSGKWTINVNAKNSKTTIVALGQKTITLNPGQTQTVTVTITTVKGYGSLDIKIVWNEADTYDPSILAQLIPATGSPITLDFTYPETGTGTYSGSNIPTGYYTLVVQLLDGGVLAMGSVEVVRIVDKNTTKGTYEFQEINEAKGNIAVNITPMMNDPIEVAIAGQVEEIVQGETMTVDASVPLETENVVYVWYINGVSKGTGSRFALGSGYEDGIYRMDVSAFTIDGERAGSVSHMFRVRKPA
jgi:hypothetical protein